MIENFLNIYEIFEKKGLENPLLETVKLFNILTEGKIAKADMSLIDHGAGSFEEIAEKRKKGTPMEYVVGMGTFFGQLFICEPGALIPREETELLVRTAIGKISSLSAGEPMNIIDMGTGSGSIAISIARNTAGTQFYASDLNPETTAVARKNIDKFNLSHRITLLQGDLFSPYENLGLHENIDVIVCNPPYIPSTSLKNMASEIIDFEPEEAFNGGAFGLEFYRRLIKDSLNYLKSGGLLIFEIGAGQEKLILRLFSKINGYTDIETYEDGVQIRVICVKKRMNRI